jgi:hypothetical protein
LLSDLLKFSSAFLRWKISDRIVGRSEAIHVERKRGLGWRRVDASERHASHREHFAEGEHFLIDHAKTFSMTSVANTGAIATPCPLQQQAA